MTFTVDNWEKFGQFLVSFIKSEIQNEGIVVTGDYLASIKIFELDGNSVTIGSDSDHARVLEYGRGPIVPVNAKVLHWIDSETGEDVFSTYSGPTEPTHILERSVLKGIKVYAAQL